MILIFECLLFRFKLKIKNHSKPLLFHVKTDKTSQPIKINQHFFQKKMLQKNNILYTSKQFQKSITELLHIVKILLKNMKKDKKNRNV